MIFGQVTSHVAIIVLSLCWPAYQSFKAANLSTSTTSPACKEWLIYWIVLALFLAAQWLADMTINWLPLYYDAKVAFVVMLWHPKVRGATFLYSHYLEPLMRSHEATIDQSLMEARTRTLDHVNGYLVKAKQYASQHTSGLVEQVKTFTEQGAQASATAPAMQGAQGHAPTGPIAQEPPKSPPHLHRD